jgi:hypothetical protein
MRLAVIERVGELEPLIEIGLRQLARGCDLVRHSAEPLSQRRIRVGESGRRRDRLHFCLRHPVRVCAKRSMTRLTLTDADPLAVALWMTIDLDSLLIGDRITLRGLFPPLFM